MHEIIKNILKNIFTKGFFQKRYFYIDNDNYKIINL